MPPRASAIESRVLLRGEGDLRIVRSDGARDDGPRCRGPFEELRLRVIDVRIRWRRDELRSPAGRPKAIDRPVPGDRVQPCRQGSRRRVERLCPVPEREEGVLDHLFGYPHDPMSAGMPQRTPQRHAGHRGSPGHRTTRSRPCGRERRRLGGRDGPRACLRFPCLSGFTGRRDEPQWPVLERTPEHDLCLGREHMGRRLEAHEDLLEMVRVARPDLEQVVGFPGDVVALLDLVDRLERIGQVRPGRARRLGQPAERDDRIARRRRVDRGRVAGDDTPRLELLTRSCADGPLMPTSDPRSAYARRPSTWSRSRSRASIASILGRSAIEPLSISHVSLQTVIC